MCGTIQESIIAGLIINGTALALILTQRPKDIWLGCFLFVIGLMQWADAALWYQKSEGISTDFVSRYAIPTILALEPLVAYAGYVLYYKKRMPVIEIIYAAALLHFMVMWIMTCADTTITTDGFLKWCDYDMSSISKIAYLAMLVFPFLFYPDPVTRGLIILCLIVPWLYNFNHEAFGSRWCHSVEISCILLLFSKGDGWS